MRAAKARSCVAIRIIRSHAVSSAAKWPVIWTANIHPIVCFTPCAAPGPKAQASSPASPGMKRSMKSPPVLRPSRTNSAPKPSCLTATPAPWGCSTAPAWIAVSFIALGLRGSTARSAHRLASPVSMTLSEPATAWTGKVPPCEAHHRLGRERARHQRAPLALHRGSPP